MDGETWRRRFRVSGGRAFPETVFDPAPIPLERRRALARSLAKFQLGESGEGRIANEIRSVRLPGVDGAYCDALALFVREEGRHARILAGLVKSLGGALLARDATERLFVAGRRLLGVRTKLLVLLAAEVIGIGFYGLLSEAAEQPVLAAALREICGDERRHLAFHADFFRAQTGTRLARVLFLCGWWLVGGAAALTVLLDHRATLRALGVPRKEAARRLLAPLLEVARRVTFDARMLEDRRTAIRRGGFPPVLS